MENAYKSMVEFLGIKKEDTVAHRGEGQEDAKHAHILYKDKELLETLKRKDSKHVLSCVHAQNSIQREDYCMDCIVLKEMPGQRMKIIVFGERYWKGHDNKKQIKYVAKSRVKPKEE